MSVCRHPNSWFDRTVCAADDWMHTVCVECGQPLDGKCGERARRIDDDYRAEQDPPA